jgi:uncharacterized protein YndB with AHSA1/START domain
MTDDDRTVALKRRIGAKRDRVYEALTTPDIAKYWWGGDDPWEITSLTLDAKPGGRFEFNMKNNESGETYQTDGEYQEALENERLVWTNAEGGGTTVEVDLYDIEGYGTEVHIKQGPFRNADERDEHAKGWSEALDQLDILLQTD